jgi:hypothetical protein
VSLVDIFFTFPLHLVDHFAKNIFLSKATMNQSSIRGNGFNINPNCCRRSPTVGSVIFYSAWELWFNFVINWNTICKPKPRLQIYRQVLHKLQYKSSQGKWAMVQLVFRLTAWALAYDLCFNISYQVHKSLFWIRASLPVISDYIMISLCSVPFKNAPHLHALKQNPVIGLTTTDTWIWYHWLAELLFSVNFH